MAPGARTGHRISVPVAADAAAHRGPREVGRWGDPQRPVSFHRAKLRAELGRPGELLGICMDLHFSMKEKGHSIVNYIDLYRCLQKSKYAEAKCLGAQEVCFGSKGSEKL